MTISRIETPSIYHINSFFPTSKLHGELIACLDEKGLIQKAYIPVSARSFLGKHVPKNLHNGEIHYSYCFNELDRFLWPLKAKKIWRDFQGWFKPNTAGIIHAHSLVVNGLVAYQAFKKWNIPYVVSVRFTDIHLFLEKAFFLRPLIWDILQHAMAIIFISPAYRNTQMPRFFKGKEIQEIYDKSLVIPNGINKYWIENRRHHTPPKNKRKLIFVGSLIRRKNLKTLIKACDILNREGFEVSLSVVGDGPQLLKFQNRPHNTKVDFYGRVSDKEKLLGLYRSSDVLVVPSFIETFGLVYPEAMTQGLPVIYSQAQGFDGFYPNGHVGYSVNPKDPESIAHRIKLVYKDYSRISANALNESLLFSWETIADKIIPVYHAAIAGGKHYQA